MGKSREWDRNAAEESLKGASAALRATDWFKDGFELSGWCPVQAFGTLVTGEDVYFRARWDSASLSISSQPGIEPPDLAYYEETVTPGDRYAAGYLSGDRCLELIRRWLTAYSQQGRATRPEP